jgi:outer membrane protein assembly factor BamB
VGGLVLGVGLLLAGSSAQAIIMRLTPLEDVLKEGEYVFVARVDRLDPERPSAVLEVGEHLKGKAPFARLPVNLTGDAEAKKLKHTPQLLKRLAPKLPVVVFVTKQEGQYVAFGYTNGTWFQMTSEDKGGADPVWSFTHCEPYLRRTFKGTTDEMRQAVADGLSGKKKPPPPDEREKPGLGPEVDTRNEGAKPDKPEAPAKDAGSLAGASGLYVGDGPVFAVIPTVALGGIVSLLAMLFPAVFGGLTGQLKRWLAAITVISLNSTILALHDWLKDSLPGWWATPAALWLVMILITALGVLWAWRRSVNGGAKPQAEAPGRREPIFLCVLSAVGLVLIGVCLLLGYPLLSLPWGFVLALWSGVWVATLHSLWSWLRAGERPALPAEGVMLWAMVPACVALGLATATGGTAGQVELGQEVKAGEHVARLLGEGWTFVPDAAGYIASSPLVDGDRVYAAAAHGSAFKPFGRVYCVDRATGKHVWTFNDGGRMRQAFSSPCVADGRLYIGEGFHQDMGCKIYCLDAATGKKLWDFETGSHTESSPCVADGKVFFGAGDDGVYCLDAVTGNKLWHFNDNLHVDSNPAVVGKRLYAGAGVGDLHKTLELFCLDTDTGEPVWRVPSDLPVWGSPTVHGEHVFFGLGNGNFMFSDPERPAGALLCVQAEDGKRLWRFDGVADGVLCRPAADAAAVYFGCRDGNVYCLGRSDGRLRWKRDMGSPVVASPALARCSHCPASVSLYAAGVDGRFCCLDPQAGSVQWTHDVTKFAAQLMSSPAVVAERTSSGERRRIYFGAGVNGGANPVLYCLEDEWK